MNYARLYEYRFREVDQRDRAAVWRVIAAFIYDLLGRPGSVLDPAAGRGEFIESIPARERWAVDLVAPPGGGDDGVRWITGDVTSTDLPRSHFEAVFVSNFLEHLPSQQAVAEFLERMHRTLRPGGRLAVLGPNFRYCAREYFDFADHSVVLTHRSLAEHVHAAGFHLRRLEPRFMPYSFTGRLPTSARLTRAYLAFPPAWRVLGRQFLAVAEKR